MSDSITVVGMSKKETTVLVHARVAKSDVAEVEKAAGEQSLPVSLSRMVALVIREWANKRRSPKK